MPFVDGVEVCRRVRATTGIRQPHIIIATSRDGQKDVAEALAAGADELIRKPVDAGELAARMHAAFRTTELARKAEELQAALQVAQAFSNLSLRERPQSDRGQTVVEGTLTDDSASLGSMVRHLEELLFDLNLDAEAKSGPADVWSHLALWTPGNRRWYDFVLSTSRATSRALFQRVTSHAARQDADLVSVVSDVLGLITRALKQSWATNEVHHAEPVPASAWFGQPPQRGHPIGHLRVAVMGVSLEIIETIAEPREVDSSELSAGDVLIDPLRMPSQPDIALLPAFTLVKSSYLRRVSSLLQTAVGRSSVRVITASAFTQVARGESASPLARRSTGTTP